VVEEYRAQAEAKGLVIAVETHDRVPAVRSDPARVRQVLGNLVSNAVKYTVAGSVLVRVSADPAARAVTVAVADTGPGIPKDKQHLLFREFVRLDPDAGPGAGIGLAISNRIVSAIGGSIDMSSEVGSGTTFVLSLPLDDDHATAADDGERERIRDDGSRRSDGAGGIVARSER